MKLINKRSIFILIGFIAISLTTWATAVIVTKNSTVTYSIFTAGSNTPLEGVTATIILGDQTGVVVTVNGSEYQFQAIKEGNYCVKFEKTGYSTTLLNFSVIAPNDGIIMGDGRVYLSRVN